MKRLLALFLALCMLLSACVVQPEDPTQDSQGTVIDTTAGDPQDTTEGDAAAPVHERLVFTLTQADVDEFYRLLQESEPMAIAGEDLDAIDAITDQLDEKFEFLVDQMQIAYVLYCIDQSDEALSEQYLTTNDTVTTAQNDYLESVRRIYLSDSPAKEMLFEDWTDEDIERLLAHSDEATALEKRNAEILVEYRALDEATMAQDMIPLYSELVRNNNRIAQIYGYDNYYAYAYKNVYQRDYDSKSVAAMRQYLATYIAPICDDALLAFQEKYTGLSYIDQMMLSTILYGDYDSDSSNHVDLYLQSLPESARTQMQSMFSENRVYFATSENAYTGAFTTEFFDEPFCYFGPGYASSSTVVHELGHFYAAKFVDLNAIPMDLAETHSQGNEWLFMTFLQGQLSEDLYDALVSYKLYENLAMILVCAMVDEFEEKVYTHPNAGNLTAAQYDKLMTDVAKKYGGIDYIGTYISDMQAYWRIVAMESPVYYISYAVSAVAALNIYTLSQEDEAAAHEVYRQLAEEADEDQGFLWNIQQAGLPGPFDESVYKALYAMYVQ